MKRIITILYLVLLIISTQSVAATQPSFIEYGLRFQFSDCQNEEGYEVDLLFNKEEVDSANYSSELNPYYFNHQSTIRSLVEEDVSQIEYLDYNQEWVSYAAYYKAATSDFYPDSCTLLFGDSEYFRQRIRNFKVIILSDSGEVVAVSDVYSSDITPDHIEGHEGEMIVFNQEDHSFSLLGYEAEYEVHEANYGFLLLAFFNIMVFSLSLLVWILIILLLSAEIIVLAKERRRKETSKNTKKILLAIALASILSLLIIGKIYHHMGLAIVLTSLLQIIKVVFNYKENKKSLIPSILYAFFTIVLLYILGLSTTIL